MKQQKMVVNKDLQYERSRCTFDPVEVTHFFDGSAEKTRQRRDRGIVFIYPLSLTPIIKKIISVSFVFTVVKN